MNHDRSLLFLCRNNILQLTYIKHRGMVEIDDLLKERQNKHSIYLINLKCHLYYDLQHYIQYSNAL